jgi:hypothetical protein
MSALGVSALPQMALWCVLAGGALYTPADLAIAIIAGFKQTSDRMPLTSAMGQQRKSRLRATGTIQMQDGNG